MEQEVIQFHCADISYTLRNKNLVRKWISKVCMAHGYTIDQLSFVFCSDDYLLEINRQFLQHDYFTDIITFDNSSNKRLNVEAYISIDRVRDNAKELKLKSSEELHRVMIHGVLHALGYKDKSNKDINRMREAENHALQQWSALLDV